MCQCELEVSLRSGYTVRAYMTTVIDRAKVYIPRYGRLNLSAVIGTYPAWLVFRLPYRQ